MDRVSSSGEVVKVLHFLVFLQVQVDQAFQHFFSLSLDSLISLSVEEQVREILLDVGHGLELLGSEGNALSLADFINHLDVPINQSLKGFPHVGSLGDYEVVDFLFIVDPLEGELLVVVQFHRLVFKRVILFRFLEGQQEEPVQFFSYKEQDLPEVLGKHFDEGLRPHVAGLFERKLIHRHCDIQVLDHTISTQGVNGVVIQKFIEISLGNAQLVLQIIVVH